MDQMDLELGLKKLTPSHYFDKNNRILLFVEDRYNRKLALSKKYQIPILYPKSKLSDFVGLRSANPDNETGNT